MMRIIPDQSKRPALDPDECGDHAMSKIWPQLEHRANIRKRADQAADVISPLSIFRNGVPQHPLIAASPISEVTLEVREVLLGGAHSFGLIGNRDVDNAARHLDAHWTDI